VLRGKSGVLGRSEGVWFWVGDANHVAMVHSCWDSFSRFEKSIPDLFVDTFEFISISRDNQL
jgi:hypothetical protein